MLAFDKGNWYAGIFFIILCYSYVWWKKESVSFNRKQNKFSN